MLGISGSVSGTFASNMLVYPAVDVAGGGDVRAFIGVEGTLPSAFGETNVGTDVSIVATVTIVGNVGAEVVLG